VSLEIVFLVLLAGLVHAIWNAMVKGISSQFTSFALMNSGTAFVSWIALPFIGLPRGAAWPFVLASTACHLGYELFLMGSYRRANFSRAYPIARGVAPLLVSIGGLVFASEHLDARGFSNLLHRRGHRQSGLRAKFVATRPRRDLLGPGDRGGDCGLHRG